MGDSVVDCRPSVDSHPVEAMNSSRRLSSGTGWMVQALLLVIAVGTPLGFARAHFIDFEAPDNLLYAFTDADTYRAAGERLNAGHELYRLQEGDRPVLIIPDLFTQPLVSPPPMAGLRRGENPVAFIGPRVA